MCSPKDLLTHSRPLRNIRLDVAPELDLLRSSALLQLGMLLNMSTLRPMPNITFSLRAHSACNTSTSPAVGRRIMALEHRSEIAGDQFEHIYHRDHLDNLKQYSGIKGPRIYAFCVGTPSNLLIPHLQLVLERLDEIAVALHDHDV